LKLVLTFFSWFCRINMNKALRLPVVWQTMLFAFLFVVTGYLYYGAAVTVAVYCAPITMQNSTADTPPLHLGPDTEGALHHVLAPHSLTKRLCWLLAQVCPQLTRSSASKLDYKS